MSVSMSFCKRFSLMLDMHIFENSSMEQGNGLKFT
jgi:hypothetical protein